MEVFKLISTAAAATVLASAASAATVTIGGISGAWTDVQLPGTVDLTGVGTDTIAWGVPSNADGTNPDLQQSGYTFAAAGTPFVATSPFTVGTFTHNNFAISGSPAIPSIEQATLSLTVDGDVDGVPFTLIEEVVFDHFETPNSPGPCPGGDSTPCGDIVTIISDSTTGAIVDLGDQVVEISLAGLTFGGASVTEFLTSEGAANSAPITGSFAVSAVPLPAAGWMLLAGLGGLAAYGRRKAAQA